MVRSSSLVICICNMQYYANIVLQMSIRPLSLERQKVLKDSLFIVTYKFLWVDWNILQIWITLVVLATTLDFPPEMIGQLWIKAFHARSRHQRRDQSISLDDQSIKASHCSQKRSIFRADFIILVLFLIF